MTETNRPAITRPVITIDPEVRFGRPHIQGISCDAIAEHIMAGEDPAEVATTYGLTRAEALLACWWIGINGIGRLGHYWTDWAETNHTALAHGQYDQIQDPPAQTEYTTPKDKG